MTTRPSPPALVLQCAIQTRPSLLFDFAQHGGLDLQLGARRPIAKRTEHHTRDSYVRCPNSRCGAIYKHVNGNAHKMLQHNMKCERCGADDWLEVHCNEQRLERGEPVTWRECNAEYELQRYRSGPDWDRANACANTSLDVAERKTPLRFA